MQGLEWIIMAIVLGALAFAIPKYGPVLAKRWGRATKDIPRSFKEGKDERD